MSVGEMAKVALQSYFPLPAYRFDTSKTVEHKADSFPKPFYEFNLKLKNPKEVVRIIRCYLNNPDAAMSAISAANYEEFLLKYELAVGRENCVNALYKRVEQNNIPINSPHLERYDNLLRREVI